MVRLPGGSNEEGPTKQVWEAKIRKKKKKRATEDMEREVIEALKKRNLNWDEAI